MTNWISVCKDDDILPGTGVCAELQGEQVAIFKLAKDNALYAVSNYDPIGEANVLSRGITGSLGDALVVASPLYKQHFNLQTGECLEDANHRLKTYSVRLQDGDIQLAC